MTSMDHPTEPSGIVRQQGQGVREDDPLPRLLTQLIDRAGQPATIERAVSRPWASALFEGRRHIIRLRLDGDDAIQRSLRFMADLIDAEWPLSGHFVADIEVDGCDADDDGVWLDLSALTIRDW